jgi:sulfate/thiosulfate transport system permease protein
VDAAENGAHDVSRARAAVRDPILVRVLLVAVAVAFMVGVVVMPIAVILYSAFKDGLAVYTAALVEEQAFSAILLTLQTAAVVVPMNTLFGFAAAWAISRFRFRGKNVLITVIDLPFAVSPVIAGMIFVLLFGAHSFLGKFLIENGFKVIFALPGIILATMFVTVPFVARELLAFMQSQDHDDEEAALTLGASGWQMFLRVTLPNVKWSLVYGVILCNARAMGEFGAVSVVSGHIRGSTNTIPLHVEILYNEYAFSAAFAVSSLLVAMALLTLAVKRFVEWRSRMLRRQRAAEAAVP